jgi:hypothetical protein
MSVIPSSGITIKKSESLETHKENDPQPGLILLNKLYGPDTYVSHQYPEENYANSKVIRISNEYGANGSPGWANVVYAGLFDLMPLVGPNTNIAFAELFFYYDDYENTDPAGRDLNIYRVTEYWDDDTLTWNNQPSYNPEPLTSAKVLSSTGDWIIWDVTDDVQGYVNEWPPSDYHYGYRISDDSYWGESDIPTTMVRSVESDEEDFRPVLCVGVQVSRKQQISQQSTTGSSSQSVINIVPSSRTLINNGTLSGYVNDTSGNPIDGALVRVHFHGTYEEDYSDENGYYHVTNIPICYCMKNCTCSKEGYKTEWVLLGITENTTYDFILYPPDVYPVLNGSKCNEWWNSPVTVTFVYDPEEVAEIWYDYHGWHLYNDPFIVDEEGGVIITYYWIDIWGASSPLEYFELAIDFTPPTIDISWDVYRQTLKWHVKFDIMADDTISGMDSFLHIYINDILQIEYEIIDWGNVVFEIQWSNNFKYFTFGFGCSDIACNYIVKNVNGSDIKAFSFNKISQQSTSPLFFQILQRLMNVR